MGLKKMPATVLLKDIVDALEMQFDEQKSFLNLETGEVETISLDLLREAEEAESEDEKLDIPKWQEPEWEIAKRIVFHDEQFERLPTKYDVHEWDIMRRFADSVQDRRISDELQEAIHGAGAFRMFKSVVRRHRIEEQWYAFRDDALAEIAGDWCQARGIPCK
jgi:hypothetical protein